MEKLKMHTPDLAEENYKKLAALFPNAVTETIDDDGNVIRAIDKDVLMQEINTKVVDDGQERYQFTWPDKRKAVILANQPIAKTLRFEKEKSVGKDGTPGGIDSQNIYIEGDNLDALKLLQETYLGKVKMIYIDPACGTSGFLVAAGEYLREHFRDQVLFDPVGEQGKKSASVLGSLSDGRCQLVGDKQDGLASKTPEAREGRACGSPLRRHGRRFGRDAGKTVYIVSTPTPSNQ